MPKEPGWGIVLGDGIMDSRETTWLVLRAQAGDREALEALLAAVRSPLFGYLISVTNDRDLAEDVLQEVLFQIYRKLVWLRDPDLFAPWTYRIASRAAWRKLARMRRLGEEPLESEPVASEPADETHIDIQALPAHLEALSPASRAVLTLHYLHDRKLHEVASILELPVGTVKSRLAYGLRCLRRAIEKEAK